MPSTNSTAMTGKVECWRFVRTDLLAQLAEVTKVVAALAEATAGVVATEVEAVAMVVRPLAVSTTLLRQALRLRYRIPLPTTLHQEET